MKCDRASEKLIDDLTGNLSETESDELAQHLVTCAACRREADELRGLWTDLGRVPVRNSRPTASPLDRQAVHDPIPPAGVLRQRGWGVVAAALVIGVLGGYWFAALSVDERE